MPPKFGRRGGGWCNKLAHPLSVCCGPPHPPFKGGSKPCPPFKGQGLAHFPRGKSGKGGLQGEKRCRPPFRKGGAGPCFQRRNCQRPLQHPLMSGSVFPGTWWGASHRWHCKPRRRRHSFGRDALTIATFELARALLTLSQEDSDTSDLEEDEETPDEAEPRVTARGKSSSGVHPKEEGQWKPTEEVTGCCRSKDVWENCGPESWMTEVEVWPYAEKEVEANILDDGHVEVRCEHAHGETLVASKTQVLPCPPCGPATLTSAYGPPNAQPGMLVLLVTARGSEETDKAPAPAEEGGAPTGGDELPEEDAEIVDISDAMEKC